MKIFKKAFLLISIILLISGCNKTEVDNESKFDIGGKTFYKASNDEYVEDSEIWFGKDGSFVFKDCYYEEYVNVTGTYEINENVIKLSSTDPEYESYKTFIFEIQDEHTITLKNDLFASFMNDVYSDEKPIHDYNKVPENLLNVTLYNANNDSYIQLNDDGTFKLTEVAGVGILEYEGTWSKQGSEYLLENFGTIYSDNDSEVTIIDLIQNDEDSFMLINNLTCSRKGDVFTFYDYRGRYNTDVDGNYDELWTHEAIDGVNDEYLPMIEFNSFGQFVFKENVYTGIAEISGTYTYNDGVYECDVLEASAMQGYAGADVKEILFDRISDSEIILKTNICMSREGDKFIIKN